MNTSICRVSLLCVLLTSTMVLLIGCSSHEKALTLFQDVTAGSGLETYTGMTYGAEWGDFDGDGLPDLYVTNHLQTPGAKLFRNMGKGHFEDVTDKFFISQDLTGDKHGAAWADFNNDGREDLVQLTGGHRGIGAEAKRLFLNRGTKLEDVADTLGVSNPYGRSRMPLWFDFNRDGLLDLFQGAAQRLDDSTPPFTFIQEGGKFVESEALKFSERTMPFCIATELNGDNYPELVCRVSGLGRAARVFDTASQPAHELEDILPRTAFEDVAAADFDNDGAIDLFLTRKNPPGPVAFGRPAGNEVMADIWTDQANVDKPAGFTFRTSGKPTIQLSSAWPHDAVSLDRIHLGKKDAHPNNFTFTLSSETAGIADIGPNESGNLAGVYVGMTALDKWEVRVTAPHDALTGDKSKYQEIQVKVDSSEAITDLEAIGDPATAEKAPARLFMNRGGKLIEEGDKRGVNTRLVAGMSTVAGDFDNDMHEDIFVVASNEIGKQENLLLLNRGDGHFDVVRNAGGAAGNRFGVGDTVTTVDYDRDGFLDLLITTGGSMGRSEGLPSDDGGYHLYHNIGNGNHWIEIDLEGTKSNRDGIGALVYVTAGGVSQVRVQDGGLHHRAQNLQCLHFGLAKNAQIDKITVHWPSGTIQELNKVNADQILHIKEPSTPIGGPSPGIAK